LPRDRRRLAAPLMPEHKHPDQIRRALVETERRLATLLQNIPGMAYRCLNDEQWTMEFLSQGCLSLTGYAPDDLIDNRVACYADLIVEEDRARVWDTVQAAVSRRQTFQIEYRIRARSGDVKWVWEQGVGIHDSHGALLALEGIIHDITERRGAEVERENMEQQMRAAQRMEAVGRLAGGVAHDFNNVLTVIQSYAGFLRSELRDGDPMRDDLDVIVDAAERAARLTAQLLAFSRKQVQQLAVADLNQVVGEVDKMLRRLIGEDIDLVANLRPDLWHVKVDLTQVEQILMNLAVNARDAMPDGGKLTIETANVELDAAYGAAKNAQIPPGDYVMLAVTDTGIGMDAATRAEIFEPFFTTKPLGKGTGLGLSTVYGIVKQSGGYIWVYSEPGAGSSFKIYLPRIEGEPLSMKIRRANAIDPRGDETILIVEDEDAVRRAVARVLTGLGYDVLEAADGREALAICEQRRGDIHVMVTDIVMPQLNGRELADRAAACQPDMRVLYMSGYTDSAIVHHGRLEAGMAFLQKPFTPDVLARKVRQMLDAG
jgi:PAS domain S-box-containing protein